ncbi:MAG: hypothetical protein II453_07895, partial [Alphaproteobacteria bacterium]|nr:hypothetical protein [Alphaproteobacteria bacterium]
YTPCNQIKFAPCYSPLGVVLLLSLLASLVIFIFLASKIKTEKDKSPSPKTKKRRDKIFS